jgi:hypothetical protein
MKDEKITRLVRLNQPRLKRKHPQPPIVKHYGNTWTPTLKSAELGQRASQVWNPKTEACGNAGESCKARGTTILYAGSDTCQTCQHGWDSAKWGSLRLYRSLSSLWRSLLLKYSWASICVPFNILVRVYDKDGIIVCNILSGKHHGACGSLSYLIKHVKLHTFLKRS